MVKLWLEQYLASVCVYWQKKKTEEKEEGEQEGYGSRGGGLDKE